MLLKRALPAGFLVALVMAVFGLTLPNFYRSEAKILPVEGKGGGGFSGLASAAAAFGVNVGGADGGGDANFTDILNSRTLREGLLLSEFSFHFKQSYFGPQRGFSGRLVDFLRPTSLDQGLHSLNGMIQVSKDLKSRVITIEVETISPELSQQLIQRMLKLLEVFAQDRGRTRGGAKAAFATARLAEAHEELLQAETEFRQFMERNRNYVTSSEPSIRLQGMRQEAEFRMRQQLVTTLALNREQALLEEKNDLPILNVLDPGNLPSEKSRPARFELVIIGFLVGGLGSLVWAYRERLKPFLNLGREV